MFNNNKNVFIMHGAPSLSVIKINKYCSQGRKSMFEHGGDNIVEKYTSRLRDVLRSAAPC